MKRDSGKSSWLKIAAVAVIGFAALGGSAGAQTQDGGYESIFSYGVGGRALGLGGAYIAAPNDASAVYWNPAGLDLLSIKSATMFYANLPIGGQYNFLSYAHPTLNLGTFGIGVQRVGTDGINFTDAQGVPLGEGSFSTTQFILSYGKQAPFNLSFGFSIKIEQIGFSGPNSSPVGRGVGADFGVIYTAPFDSGILQNTSVGVIIQNAVPPILKLEVEQDQIPRNIKAGMAKSFRFGAEGDQFSLFADVEVGENKDAKLHVGSEFSYRGGAMARVGFSDNQVVFGAGASINNFQIDYSFGKFAENSALESSQRISISAKFGKTRQQIIAEERQRRDMEIANEVSKQERLRRRLEIQNHIDAGNSLFQQGEYFSASIRFNQAKELDPENQEAIRGAQTALDKYQEELTNQQEQILEQESARRAEAQKAQRIRNQLEKGIKLFEANQFDRAIAEWELALAEDPGNLTLQTWIDKTREEIGKQTRTLIQDADRFETRGEYLKAIDKLKEVRRADNVDAATQRRVDNRIVLLQNRITRDDAYRKGISEYYSRNYQDALGYFDQALRLDPNNPQLQEFRDKADARANARSEPFLNDDIKEKYKRAVFLMARKKYREALNILQAIQKQQKYKKEILNLMDEAEEALN